MFLLAGYGIVVHSWIRLCHWSRMFAGQMTRTFFALTSLQKAIAVGVLPRPGTSPIRVFVRRSAYSTFAFWKGHSSLSAGTAMWALLVLLQLSPISNRIGARRSRASGLA